MINVIKREDTNGIQIELSFDSDNSLYINYCGNLDLYIYPKVKIAKEYYDFDIGIEDKELYNIFLKLYKSIISYDPYEDGSVNKTFKRQDKNDDNPLVKNKIIKWYSDDDPIDIAPSIEITKGKNNIHLHIIIGEHQSGFISESIRISTSGSRYDNFYIPFMKLYRDICKNNFDYYQYSIEDYFKEERILQKK